MAYKWKHVLLLHAPLIHAVHVFRANLSRAVLAQHTLIPQEHVRIGPNDVQSERGRHLHHSTFLPVRSLANPNSQQLPKTRNDTRNAEETLSHTLGYNKHYMYI